MGRFGWESGDSEVGCGCLGCCIVAPFDLGEFVFGAGEADLESFDLAEPAFAFGFGYAGFEVVANLNETIALCWVWPEQSATNTSMFMDAGWPRNCCHSSSVG